MMRRVSVSVALALALVLAAAPSAKADHVFYAFQDGSQEVPPNNSPGFGFAVFVLNDNLDSLKWGMFYSGMVGTTISGAHFHNAPFGMNGGIVRGYPNSMFTLPSGYIPNGSWLSTDAQPLTFALALELFNGNIYFNIHTTPGFGGGEIRGQVWYFYSY